MNSGYRMTPEQRAKGKARIRSLYDGTVCGFGLATRRNPTGL
ncbi:hypothetical protein [Actinoplanes sp. NPDC049802]